MIKLFGLFLIFSISFASAKNVDSLQVYSWEEAQKINPLEVFAISFQKSKLTEVPAELKKYKALIYLDLSKNKLNSLPDFIGDFDSLQTLNLHKNNFHNFPMQICRMGNIQKLILSRNSFSQLPECIEFLKKLAYIDLSDTPVTSFPQAFLVMPQLKTLSLHGLAYSPSFQKSWKERLTWMRIEFDPPCNCFD